VGDDRVLQDLARGQPAPEERIVARAVRRHGDEVRAGGRSADDEALRERRAEFVCVLDRLVERRASAGWVGTARVGG
jgi:hypothetical protein